MATPNSGPACTWYLFMLLIAAMLFYDFVTKLLVGALIIVGIVLLITGILNHTTTYGNSGTPDHQRPKENSPHRD